MSSSVEEQFKDLLSPIKDPEQSFNVNISELLEDYLQKFRHGEVPPNFNAAALLLQGSSSIYGKKVEHLHKLATNLHEGLTRNKKEDETETIKKKHPKEKIVKQVKEYDPFCSIELKRAKNLSCLTQKKYAKWLPSAAKKGKQAQSVEKKHTFVPVDLLPFEGEDKGDIFYDVHGEKVGHRNDFVLNQCTITQSGWLLLPTVSPDMIEVDKPQNVQCGQEDTDEESDHDLDEGYPVSSGCPSTMPPSQDIPSSDEGLGSSVMGTPSEASTSQPQTEQNTPMDIAGGVADTEDLPTEEDFTEDNPRRSTRKGRKTKQKDQERDNGPKDDIFAVWKPIEKNSTVCYPPGMRSGKSNAHTLHPASVYCVQTFFTLPTKAQKNDFFSLQVKAFANNSKFLKQIKKFKEAIKAAQNKKKTNGEVIPLNEEEGEIENLKAVDLDHSFAVNPNLTNDDFAVDNDPVLPFEDESPMGEDLSLDVLFGDAEPMEEGACAAAPLDAPELPTDEDYDRALYEQMVLFQEEFQSDEMTEEMGERVRQWQKRVRPFLADISQREKFNINLYGSRILDYFDESNRRQTITFRDFCQGMEKWEVHRYFMALLPLINQSNVMVSNEPRENSEEGEEDIAITLLSRRMHHMELEEFGHGEGEHQ